jgi:hypothetical protein
VGLPRDVIAPPPDEEIEICTFVSAIYFVMIQLRIPTAGPCNRRRPIRQTCCQFFIRYIKVYATAFDVQFDHVASLNHG